MIDWPLERDLERSFEAAREVRARIARHIRHTPLVELDAREPEAGPTRSLKLETLQRTGSFKIRGAASALTAAAAPAEIVAASTGSHGLAVAALARSLSVPCRIFVPATAAKSTSGASGRSSRSSRPSVAAPRMTCGSL